MLVDPDDMHVFMADPDNALSRRKGEQLFVPCEWFWDCTIEAIATYHRLHPRVCVIVYEKCEIPDSGDVAIDYDNNNFCIDCLKTCQCIDTVFPSFLSNYHIYLGCHKIIFICFKVIIFAWFIIIYLFLSIHYIYIVLNIVVFVIFNLEVILSLMSWLQASNYILLSVFYN